MLAYLPISYGVVKQLNSTTQELRNKHFYILVEKNKQN